MEIIGIEQEQLIVSIVSLLIGISASLIAAVILRRNMSLRAVLIRSVSLFIVGTLISYFTVTSVTITEVPYIKGLAAADATSKLTKNGLKAISSEQYNDAVERGRVIDQDLPAGLSVWKGTEVNFIVSKGPPFGVIVVESIPSGAEMYLDETYQGSTPIDVRTLSGKHTVKIRKSGYADWSQSITVIGDSKSLVYAQLISAVPTPTPTTPQTTTPQPTPPPTITPSLPITLKYSDFDPLDRVCTYEDNYCGWATAPGKAIIYGSMTKSRIKVPDGTSKLKVIISIPCNGWGEGLSGPDGSAALIIVDGISKKEKIDSTMKFHHENYYKYEFCSTFLNTFDISGKNEITLKIEMAGAHLDFQQAQLVFT